MTYITLIVKAMTYLTLEILAHDYDIRHLASLTTTN